MYHELQKVGTRATTLIGVKPDVRHIFRMCARHTSGRQQNRGDWVNLVCLFIRERGLMGEAKFQEGTRTI
jgi:hypothetical protein